MPNVAVMESPRNESESTPAFWMAVFLFLSVAGLYLLSMPGYLSMDEESMFLVSRSIVEQGDVNIEGGLLERYTESRGVRGNRYAVQEIGHPAYGSLFYMLARSTSGVVPVEYHPFYKRIVVQCAGPVAGAACVVLLFLYLGHLGFSPERSLFFSCGLAVSSPFWVYGSTFFRGPVLAFFLLGFVFAVNVFLNTASTRSFLLATLSGAVLCVTKAIYFPVCVPALIGIVLYRCVWQPVSPDRRRAVHLLLGGSVIFLGAAGIDLYYNMARFGSMLETGYDLSERFSSSVPIGLSGMLVSPGKSLFVYAPLLLLVLPGFVVLYRKRRVLFLVLTVIVLYQLLVYSGWYLWGGGYGSWGPRHVVPVLPVLFVVSGFGFDALRTRISSRAGEVGFGIVVGVLFLAGAGLQVLGNLTGGERMGPYRNGKLTLQEERWTFSGSRALGYRGWASLGHLRWHRIADPPDFTVSVQQPDMKNVRRETPRLWWVLLYRLGLPVSYLSPALVFFAFFLFGVIGLVWVWSVGLFRGQPSGG